MNKKIKWLGFIFCSFFCLSAYESQLSINHTIVIKNLTQKQYNEFIVKSLNCALSYKITNNQWGFTRFIFLARNTHLYLYQAFLCDKTKSKEENRMLEAQRFADVYKHQESMISISKQQINHVLDACNKIANERIEFDG